jgi:hypothetical protein
MKKFNQVHRKQLYYWLGYHIDYPTPDSKQVKLDDAVRSKYVDALKRSLTQGLWVKTPGTPDRLGNVPGGTHFQVHRPIACFTEWQVNESLAHTTRYGRMGLGFPRDFVFKRGGHPIVYVKGIHSGDQYTKNMITLRDFLKDSRLEELFDADELEGHQRRLDYITHFAKWARRPPAPKVVIGRKSTKASVKRNAAARATAAAEAKFIRRFGTLQEYLEEREWRIVYHSTFKKYFVKPGREKPAPDYYIPFKTGHELFTVVLPDNRTVNMVMNTKFFVERLFPADAPHVTVLSLEDVNTF